MNSPASTTPKRGRPRKLETWTSQLLADKAAEYFKKCNSRTKEVATKDGIAFITDPEPYSVEGLCSYCQILRSEFYSWRKRDDDLGRRANLIHQTITANRISGALDGSQNSAFAQFMLKNNNSEDYRDKVEVDHGVSGELVSIFDLCRTMEVKP